MKIVEDKKEFNFGVLGYQFNKYDNTYDANWLMLQFDYSDENRKYEGKDPCILTWEIEDISEGLDSVLMGKNTCYFSSLLEPYLKLVAIKHDDTYIIAASFYYYASEDDCRSWELCQEFSKCEFSLWLKELQIIVEKYPFRECEERE